MTDQLLATPLNEAHRALGARMVEFAGYAMPVQYAEGVLKEHQWTRAHAGLFDVSHMGQAVLDGPDPFGALERVSPGRFRNLACRQRYTVLLNDDGGIDDDLMVSEPGPAGQAFVVANASRKSADFARLRADLSDHQLTELPDRALIALQGPEAAAVLSGVFPEASALQFMGSRRLDSGEVISRSGYTGEDGFEISVGADQAQALWSRLLADDRVRPVGLGARDSLRLEAGLPLWGHDIDATTSPVEAGLGFAIAKARREADDFPGSGRILRELREGPDRIRVGLLVEGAPAREGAPITDQAGQEVGRVTSGGFSPTLGRPIAMAYLPPRLAEPGARLNAIVRDRPQPATVTKLPFVPHRYARGV